MFCVPARVLSPAEAKILGTNSLPDNGNISPPGESIVVNCGLNCCFCLTLFLDFLNALGWAICYAATDLAG